MNKEILKQQIENFKPFNEQEEKDQQYFLKFIDTFEDVVTRENIFGHFSASAFVINEDFTKTLLLNHKSLGGYVYPGGHADGEYDLLSVAKREVEEETGLMVYPYSEKIFAIQANPYKGHIKRGEYVSSHTHLDVLYLLIAKNNDMAKVRILESENSDIIWVNLEDCYDEKVIDYIQPTNEKIVKKIRSLKNERN